jgi:hypothetical protein
MKTCVCGLHDICGNCERLKDELDSANQNGQYLLYESIFDTVIYSLDKIHPKPIHANNSQDLSSFLFSFLLCASTQLQHLLILSATRPDSSSDLQEARAQ